MSDMLRFLHQLSRCALAALALSVACCWAADAVRFRITDSIGRSQSCEVKIFRNGYLPDAPNLAGKFFGCQAKDISDGLYYYDLGASKRRGILHVNGTHVVKVIEDPDEVPGLAIEMPNPTPVGGRLVGQLLEPEKARRLRLRISSIWGEAAYDSVVQANGSFHFSAVPSGDYVVALIDTTALVQAWAIRKGRGPIEGLELRLTAVLR